MRTCASRLRVFCAPIVFAVAPPAVFASADIPEWELETQSTWSFSGAAPAADAHHTFSAEHRWPVGRGWSVGLGAAAERFSFSSKSSAAPRRLESTAGLVALEYFQEGEAVAGLALRPGRYVADRAGGAAWDVPVDAVTGFPIAGNWNGMVGISAGRFYRRPLPIGGIVWQPRPGLRVDAAFPEPAVTMKFSGVTVRMGGELVGAGYHRDDVSPGGRSVEYYAYRVGVSLEFALRKINVTTRVGFEPERRFEFSSGRAAVREHSAAFVGLGIDFLRH